jgi:hypothetical protein
MTIKHDEPTDRRNGEPEYAPGWTHIDLKLHFESREHYQAAESIAAITVSFQVAYDAICEGMGYPQAALKVLRIDYPNMSISLAGLGDAVKALGELLKSVPQVIVGLVTIRGAVKVRQAKLQRQLVEEQTRLLEAQRKLREEEAREDGAGRALRTEAAKAHVETASAKVSLAKERRKAAATGMDPDMKKLAAIRGAARATRNAPRDMRPQLFVEGVRYRVPPVAGFPTVHLEARVREPEADEVGVLRARP